MSNSTEVSSVVIDRLTRLPRERRSPGARPTEPVTPAYAGIVDKPPEFSWIDKDQIHVDKRYQRDVNPRLADHIAKN